MALSEQVSWDLYTFSRVCLKQSNKTTTTTTTRWKKKQQRITYQIVYSHSLNPQSVCTHITPGGVTWTGCIFIVFFPYFFFYYCLSPITLFTANLYFCRISIDTAQYLQVSSLQMHPNLFCFSFFTASNLPFYVKISRYHWSSFVFVPHSHLSFWKLKSNNIEINPNDMCLSVNIVFFPFSNSTAANCFDHTWVSFLEFMFRISHSFSYIIYIFFAEFLTNFDLLQYLVLPRALFFSSNREMLVNLFGK